MRWYILRTLLKKEFERHRANSGGIIMAGLLVVASLLLSVFGKTDVKTGNLGGGVERCIVDYWEPEPGPFVKYLQENVPLDLKDHLEFRWARKAPTTEDENIVYSPGVGAIQIRPARHPTHPMDYLILFWYPGDDANVMAPYEAWFWESTQYYTQEKIKLIPTGFRSAMQVPTFETDEQSLHNHIDARAGIVTALVIFAMFFVCVYLLPSMTCEEHERGVLLAQALSPAEPREIMAAKFLFYPVIALALAGMIIAAYRPRALGDGFLWLALAVSAAGSLGIGLTIASLARTQRTASLGAMCYLFVIALLQFVCQQTNLPFLNYLTLEYHCPRMIHAVLTNHRYWYHTWNLICAMWLAAIWAFVATRLFRARGWQ
jgi:hypothetical protein